MPLAIQQAISDSPTGTYCSLDQQDEAMTSPYGKVLHDPVQFYKSAFWLNKARFEQARQRLRATAALGLDWDTYGAEAPNDIARRLAVEVLALLEAASLPPTRLLPSAEGGIAMSFAEGERRAEIEVYNTGEIAAATYSGQSEPTVWAPDATESSLKSTIEEFRVRLSA